MTRSNICEATRGVRFLHAARRGRTGQWLIMHVWLLAFWGSASF